MASLKYTPLIFDTDAGDERPCAGKVDVDRVKPKPVELIDGDEGSGPESFNGEGAEERDPREILDALNNSPVRSIQNESPKAATRIAGVTKHASLDLSIQSAAFDSSQTFAQNENMSSIKGPSEVHTLSPVKKKKFFPTRRKTATNGSSAPSNELDEFSAEFGMLFPAANLSTHSTELAPRPRSHSLSTTNHNKSLREVAPKPLTSSVSVSMSSVITTSLVHAHHTAISFDRTVTYLDISGLGLETLEPMCLEVAFPSLITLVAANNRLKSLPSDRFFGDRRSTSASQLWHLDFSSNLLDFGGSDSEGKREESALHDTKSVKNGHQPAVNDRAILSHPQLALVCPVLGSLNLSGNLQLSIDGVRRVLAGLIVADLYLSESLVGRGNLAHDATRLMARERGADGKSLRMNSTSDQKEPAEGLAAILESLGGCLSVNGYCLPVPMALQSKRYELVQQALRTAATQWRPQRDLLRCLRRRNTEETTEPNVEARELLTCFVCANENLKLSATVVGRRKAEGLSEADEKEKQSREPWELPQGHFVGKGSYAYNPQRSFWHQPPIRWQLWKIIDSLSLNSSLTPTPGREISEGALIDDGDGARKKNERFSYVFIHTVAAAAECEYLDQETLAIITARLIDKELNERRRLSKESNTKNGNLKRCSNTSTSNNNNRLLEQLSEEDEEAIALLAGDVITWPMYALQFVAYRLCTHKQMEYPTQPIDIDVMVVHKHVQLALADDSFAGLVKVSAGFERRVRHFKLNSATAGRPSSGLDNDNVATSAAALRRKFAHIQSNVAILRRGGDDDADAVLSLDEKKAAANAMPTGYRSRLFSRLNGGQSIRDTLHFVTEEDDPRNKNKNGNTTTNADGHASAFVRIPSSVAADRRQHRCGGGVWVPDREPTNGANRNRLCRSTASPLVSLSPPKRVQNAASNTYHEFDGGTFELTMVSDIGSGRHRNTSPSNQAELLDVEIGSASLSVSPIRNKMEKNTENNSEAENELLQSPNDTPLLGSDKVCSRGFSGAGPLQMERIRQLNERSRAIAMESRAERADMSFKHAVLRQPPLRVPRPSSCIEIQQNLLEVQNERERSATTQHTSMSESSLPPLPPLAAGDAHMSNSASVYHNSNTMSVRTATDLGLLSQTTRVGVQISRPATPARDGSSSACSVSNAANETRTRQSEREKLIAGMTLEEYMAFNGIKNVCGDQKLIQSVLSWGNGDSNDGPEELRVEERLQALFGENKGKGKIHAADVGADGSSLKLQWPVPNYMNRIEGVSKADELPPHHANTSTLQRAVVSQFAHAKQAQRTIHETSSAPLLTADTREGSRQWADVSNAVRVVDVGASMHPFTAMAVETMNKMRARSELKRRLLDVGSRNTTAARTNVGGRSFGCGTGASGDTSLLVMATNAGSPVGGGIEGLEEAQARATACSSSLRNIRVEHQSADSHQFIPIEIRRELERRKRGKGKE